MLAVLLVMLLPAPARAQAASGAGDDVSAIQAELDRDYAATLASDCPTACLALESMRRATEKLCALDPAERCTAARRKLADATARVTAACPSCGPSFRDEEKKAPIAPAPPAPAESVVQAESVQKKGGCAGCATASGPEEAVAPVVLAGLAILAARGRRRRRGETP